MRPDDLLKLARDHMAAEAERMFLHESLSFAQIAERLGVEVRSIRRLLLTAFDVLGG